MSEFFEIAYAAASGQLCLFTGTGFSKAVTKGDAPSWQELLESICDVDSQLKDLKDALFSSAEQTKSLSLEEAAQIISIKLSNMGKNIYDEISNRISLLTR